MIARAIIALDMRLICLLILVASAAVAQVTDGVTITVTRQANIAPDQAEFNAVLTTALDTTQQQVTQALNDLGVPNPVVTAVAIASNTYSYPPSDTSQLYFQVTFTTTPAAMKDVAKKLDAFRSTPPAGFTSVQYGAALTTSQAAIDAAHQTALPLMIAEARTKAQALASAAGLKVGGIVGISEYGSGVGYPVGGFGIASAVLGIISSSSSSTGSSFAFSATVKFAVQ
jgi:uncharacterized protein YggE